MSCSIFLLFKVSNQCFWSLGDLTIRNLKAQDAGDYRVRVVDQGGAPERRIKLVVRG